MIFKNTPDAPFSTTGINPLVGLDPIQYLSHTTFFPLQSMKDMVQVGRL